MGGPLAVNLTPMWQALINAGVGAVIALVILIGLFRLASKYMGQFLANQRRQTEAMAAQATSMTNLAEAIRKNVERDNNDHREIMILLRLITEELRGLKGQGKDGSD